MILPEFINILNIINDIRINVTFDIFLPFYFIINLHGDCQKIHFNFSLAEKVTFLGENVPPCGV